VPTHRDDVMQRIAPAPLPSAAAVGVSILRGGSGGDAGAEESVRIVSADTVRREQSYLPSHRSTNITESMARTNWSPGDTTTAWRVTRGIAAAHSQREVAARLRLQLAGGALAFV
jgi:hypothetical protein